MKFYTKADLTKENVDKALREAKEAGDRELQMLQETTCRTSFNDQEDALAYFRQQGDVTLEEFNNMIRENF